MDTGHNLIIGRLKRIQASLDALGELEAVRPEIPADAVEQFVKLEYEIVKRGGYDALMKWMRTVVGKSEVSA